METSTILIVDDMEIGRETLADLLDTPGIQLIFASNGPEALAKAAEFVPDLILLDVMMPEMDGYEVCRRVRANPIMAEVPIIMVTALDDRNSRLQGIEAGADDFISKPFDRLELQIRVNSIIRLNRYRRLLTERSKFEWVVNKASAGYVMLDDHDQILYANLQARLWLGLSPKMDILAPETFLDLVKKQYHCEPQEIWQTWPDLPPFLPQEAARYLVRPESATVEALWLQVEQMAMESGSAEKYVLRLSNVTASMKKQSVMWSFHSQVSHKLRTPSTLLTGILSILEEDLVALPEAELRSYLAIARKNAFQLQDQIQAVFQYIELSEKIRSSWRCCQLGQLATIVDQIKTGLGLSAVNIVYDNLDDPNEIQVALADQSLELIFWELLENAKIFHPQHSPVVRITLSQQPDGIRIQVEDDGQSLSPEQLAKVWLPYFQAEKYFTGQMPGMGLGLSMVATLVWEAGGTCRIFNRPTGPGIVVELVLPLAANDNL